MVLLAGLITLPLFADPPVKKRVKRSGPPTRERIQKGKPVGKKKVVGDRDVRNRPRVISSEKRRAAPAEPQKRFVRTRRDFGHVRVARCHRRDDGHLHIRPILVRSAKVRPVVLDRFEERRREHLRSIIRHFRTGQRQQAVSAWRVFVDGLAEYHEPIDLDEVMLLVAREGCAYDDDAFLFQAAKLEFLRESRERLRDYVELLYEQREACQRGRRSCSPATVRNIEAELLRMRAESDVLTIREQAADAELDAVVRSSPDYEARFATVFEDMYREVEVRIVFSP
jgi:hypothetical protein